MKLALDVITAVKLVLLVGLTHSALPVILWELKIELILVALLEHVCVTSISMMIYLMSSVYPVIIHVQFAAVPLLIHVQIVELME